MRAATSRWVHRWLVRLALAGDPVDGPRHRLLWPATVLDPRTVGVLLGMRRSARLTTPLLDTARTGAYAAVWRDAAQAAGARVELGPGGTLRLDRDGHCVELGSNLVPLDGQEALATAGDKWATRRLLRDSGVPTPRAVRVGPHATGPAFDLLAATGRCVVKPARDTGGGLGVVCDVRTPSELVRALVAAGRWSRDVLVEEQLDGAELRVLVLDGRVVGAVRRYRPVVVGDGVSSVAALVVAENWRRVLAHGADGQWGIAPDLDTQLAVRHAGLRLTSVPAAGCRVTVKGAASATAGHDHETVTVGGPLEADVLRSVDALGLRWAAVELITPDPSRSLCSAGGAVIEVNSTPGLLYHYQVREVATRVPVARAVVETLMRESPCRPLATPRRPVDDAVPGASPGELRPGAAPPR